MKRTTALRPFPSTMSLLVFCGFLALLTATGCGRHRPELRGTVLTSFDVLKPGHRWIGDGQPRPEGDLVPLERVEVKMLNPAQGREAQTFTNQAGRFETALPVTIIGGEMDVLRIVVTKPGFEPYEITCKGADLASYRARADREGVKPFIEVWLPPRIE